MSCWDQSCTDHRILCLQTPTSWSRHTVISHIERLGSWAVFEQAPAGSAIYIFSEERWRPCSLVTWCSEFRCKEELWFCDMFSLGGNFIQFLSQSIPLQASQQKNSSTSSTHFNKTSCCFVVLHICPQNSLLKTSLADTSRWRFSRTWMAKMWGESIPMGDSWYLGESDRDASLEVPDSPVNIPKSSWISI